jgi:tetratricopeptide (TPR) repeat protein
LLDDLYQLRDRARRALDQGRPEEAVAALVAAAGETHVAEHDYVSVLRPLGELLERRKDYRGALTVFWYLASHDPAGWEHCVALGPNVPPADRARTLAAMGHMDKAAREMEDAGGVAAAAIYREKAGDWQGARALWSRLAQVLSRGAKALGGDAYNAALVQFNLARCAKQCGDSRQAHDALVLAVRLLEEGADHFETVGLRERAFDCFQVLIQLGREHKSFEDVLEGFVNCIRILREDHLKYFALQYLDDAIAAAKEREELSAAATLALEASQYARAIGLAAASAHYVVMQGELWKAVAQQHLSRGDPPEIAENALLAAVVAFGDVGQFGRVGHLYTELGQLELQASRREHYVRAARRYEAVRDEAIDLAPLPAHVRQDTHFPDVWHVDLLEWEQAGSAVEGCADVLLGKSWPDLIRRKALLARLTAFEVELAPPTDAPESIGARVKLADQLAQIQLYVVLSPLERLFSDPHRAVRLAVLSALQRLFFKRSFLTIRTALRDGDGGVADYAATALESLYFPHAFDPLSRIVRESTSPRARSSAIKALANVDTVEAAEFLLGILEHGSPHDRDAAVRSLGDARGGSFAALAKEQLPQSSAAMQVVLRNILGNRAS